jgi:predicted HTH domain antitoxin
MTKITIEVPDDVFSALRRSPQEFAREMRQAAAIQWYSQGLISQGKAAEIAGLDRTAFLYSLAHAKVDAFQIEAEELREEVERDLQARRERLAAHRPGPAHTNMLIR